MKAIQTYIRRATSADAELVSTLATVTFYEAYFEMDEASNLANYIVKSFNLAKIADELADSEIIYLLAFRAEKAVGYAKLAKNAHLECLKHTNTIELKRLYVLEHVYGEEFGRLLLEKSLEIARDNNFASLWLQVWNQNQRAQKFYKKFAFEEMGTINVPYGNVCGTNLVLEINL